MGRQPRRAPEVVPNQERHRPLSLQTTDFGHVTRDGRIIQDGTYYRWSKKGDEIGMKGLERKIKRGRPFGITCCRLRLSRADSSCSFSCCHLCVIFKILLCSSTLYLQLIPRLIPRSYTREYTKYTFGTRCNGEYTDTLGSGAWEEAGAMEGLWVL